MQYTLRQIPSEIDRALRKLAVQEGKSLNRAALDALMRGLGITHAAKRDLSDVVGTWHADHLTDEALAEQRCIEADLWR